MSRKSPSDLAVSSSIHCVLTRLTVAEAVAMNASLAIDAFNVCQLPYMHLAVQVKVAGMEAVEYVATESFFRGCPVF